MVDDAVVREVEPDPGEPLVMGVDVARFGEDESVARFRQGRDARTIPAHRWRGLNLMDLADRVAEVIDRYRPDHVMVDGAGVGGGLVDRLRQMGYQIVDVQFGGRSTDPERWLNKRVECWERMGEWLVTASIDGDDNLTLDLTAPTYDITGKGQKKLETKAEMKKRGLASPNDGDALAITFGQRVSRVDMRYSRRSPVRHDAVLTDYDVFSL